MNSYSQSIQIEKRSWHMQKAVNLAVTGGVTIGVNAAD